MTTQREGAPVEIVETGTTEGSFTWVVVDLPGDGRSAAEEYEWEPLRPVLAESGVEWPADMARSRLGWQLRTISLARTPGFSAEWVTGVTVEAVVGLEPSDPALRFRVSAVSIGSVEDRVLLIVQHPDVPLSGSYIETELPDPPPVSDLQLEFRTQPALIRSKSMGEMAAALLLAQTRALGPTLQALSSQLERAESGFFWLMQQLGRASEPLEAERIGDLQRSFFELSTLLGRLEPLLAGVESSAADAPAWFVDGAGSARSDVVARYREAATRALSLRQDVRAAVDMMGSTIASQQLVLAQAEQARTDAFQRNVAFFGSLALVPTLIASIFSADVWLPFENERLRFLVFIVLMIGGGLAAAVTLRTVVSRGRAESPGAED